MRLLVCFVGILFFVQNHLFAQERVIGPPSNANTVANNLGGDRMILPLHVTYRFPAFEEGSILFRNGEKVAMVMNYNVARDELHYLNEKGDTISVNDPLTINYATIAKCRFYFSKGKYLQTIETKAGIRLAYRQEIKIVAARSVVAYADPNYQGKNAVFPDLLTGDSKKVNFNTGGWAGIIYVDKYFYFGDDYGNFTKAGKSNLLGYFKKGQAPIKEFINSHHTNFYKLDDIHNLLQFCDTLK